MTISICTRYGFRQWPFSTTTGILASYIHSGKKNGTLDEMYVDIGAYGTPRKANFDNTSALPLLEKFVTDHQGYQALYAKTTLSREDFRTMFDHTGYEIIRKQLPFCTQAFDEVYDKVSSKGRISPVEMRNWKNHNEPGVK